MIRDSNLTHDSNLTRDSNLIHDSNLTREMSMHYGRVVLGKRSTEQVPFTFYGCHFMFCNLLIQKFGTR